MASHEHARADWLSIWYYDWHKMSAAQLASPNDVASVDRTMSENGMPSINFHAKPCMWMAWGSLNVSPPYETMSTKQTSHQRKACCNLATSGDTISERNLTRVWHNAGLSKAIITKNTCMRIAAVYWPFSTAGEVGSVLKLKYKPINDCRRWELCLTLLESWVWLTRELSNTQIGATMRGNDTMTLWLPYTACHVALVIGELTLDKKSCCKVRALFIFEPTAEIR